MDDGSSRTLRQLVGNLSVDLRLLVVQLAAVARAESRAAARILTASVVGIVVGALVVFLGLGVLAAALVLGAVALGLPPWAAALIVGVLLLLAGGGAAYVCVGRLRQAPLALPETRATITETVTWLKAQTQR